MGKESGAVLYECSNPVRPTSVLFAIVGLLGALAILYFGGTSALADPAVCAVLVMCGVVSIMALVSVVRGGSYGVRVTDGEILYWTPHKRALIKRSDVVSVGIVQNGATFSDAGPGGAFVSLNIVTAEGDFLISENCCDLLRLEQVLKTTPPAACRRPS